MRKGVQTDIICDQSKHVEILLGTTTYRQEGYATQPVLGVIGNIAFPLSSKKGKLISPPSPKVEFTRSPPVAQVLLSNKDSQSVEAQSSSSECN